MLLGSSLCAQAEDNYPNRPIRVIVPYPPGGIVETIARDVTEQIGRELEAAGGGGNKAGCQ